MHRTLLLARHAVLGAILGSLALSAAADAPDPTFRPEAFRSHVAFLADDLLEGRGTGTPRSWPKTFTSSCIRSVSLLKGESSTSAARPFLAAPM